VGLICMNGEQLDVLSISRPVLVMLGLRHPPGSGYDARKGVPLLMADQPGAGFRPLARPRSRVVPPAGV
jgi:hypothetical protein